MITVQAHAQDVNVLSWNRYVLQIRTQTVKPGRRDVK
jgi:hypothetical protein